MSLSHSKLDIVIAAFGTGVDIYLQPLMRSIEAFSPNAKPLIVGKNVQIPPKDLQKIQSAKEASSYAQINPSGLKIVCWRIGLESAKAPWVLFIDADALIIDGKTGLLVDPEPGQIRSTVERLLTNRGIKRTIRHECTRLCP